LKERLGAPLVLCAKSKPVRSPALGCGCWRLGNSLLPQVRQPTERDCNALLAARRSAAYGHRVPRSFQWLMATIDQFRNALAGRLRWTLASGLLLWPRCPRLARGELESVVTSDRRDHGISLCGRYFTYESRAGDQQQHPLVSHNFISNLPISPLKP